MEKSIYSSKELSNFTKRCIRCSEKEKQISNLWSESKNVLIFRKKIAEKLNDNEQAFYEIVKEEPNLSWVQVRQRFNNVIKTESNVGALLVGNESFAVHIHNGHGDGCTRVCVFNSITDDVNVLTNLMNYQTTLEGVFNIYWYDLASRKDVRNIVKTLSGNYEVFTYDGLVALIKH